MHDIFDTPLYRAKEKSGKNPNTTKEYREGELERVDQIVPLCVKLEDVMNVLRQYFQNLNDKLLPYWTKS